MSPELQNFYNAYATWLNNGAPDYSTFDRNIGLCTSLKFFNDNEGYASIELDRQFIDAGMSCAFPFDDYEDYFVEKEMRTMHLNPLRRAWVFKHAEVEENEV